MTTYFSPYKATYITPQEAAKEMGTQVQAVYAAIKLGKLKAIKFGLRLAIDLDSLSHYIQYRYSPEKKVKADGTAVYNRELGKYSAGELAAACSMSPQRIYYLLYKGALKHERYGSLYIVDVRDFEEVTGIMTGLKR